MNKELILQEEKEYWQAEALKARELVEMHAAATRKAREQNKELEDLRTENICKLAAITELASLCSKYGQPMPAVIYNSITAIELQERVVYAREHFPTFKKPSQPEYILMAWNGNGGYYSDTRALSDEDRKKIAAINRQKKVALYAKVVA